MVNNIQVLRAFAALAVTFRHTLMWFGTDPGWGLLHVGRAGVDVFFVISGFIMFHTTQTQERTMVQFWTDRVIRIVPIYWLLTFFTIGLYLAGLPAADIQHLEFNDVPLAMAFVPNVRGDEYPVPILAAGWTLTFEMYFYALFGLTFFLRSQTKALFALTVFFLGVFLFSTQVNLPFTLSYWFQPITLEFAAGGLLALFYRGLTIPPRLPAKAAGYGLIVVGVIALLIAAAIFKDATSEPTPLRTLVYGPPAVMIVAGALLLERAGVIWKSRTLLLLGAASYSIYLIHTPILEYASLLWKSLPPAPQPFAPVVMLLSHAAAFAAAALAGLALYFAFEKPIYAFLKARFGSRRRQNVAIAAAE